MAEIRDSRSKLLRPGDRVKSVSPVCGRVIEADQDLVVRYDNGIEIKHSLFGVQPTYALFRISSEGGER